MQANFSESLTSERYFFAKCLAAILNFEAEEGWGEKKFLPRGWVIGDRNEGYWRMLAEAQYFFAKYLAAILNF